MQIEVVRSARRRKTVQARLEGGVLRVRIPAAATAAEEAQYVQRMRERFRRRAASAEVDLAARAQTLAGRYGLPRPASVRWVANQHTRWGSCTPADQTVRISDRMAEVPRWVLDAVLVHELAHLAHPGHGPRWRELAERHPRMERATGFLLALSWMGAPPQVHQEEDQQDQQAGHPDDRPGS